MSDLTWIGASQEKGLAVEIEVRSDSVLVVFIPKDVSAESPSLCSLLEHKTLERLSGDGAAFSKWCVESGHMAAGRAHAGVTFRLLGDSSRFSSLANRLTALGFYSGKVVPLGDRDVSRVQFFPAEGRIRLERANEQPNQLRATSRTRVMVVDDSETIRKLLSRVIASDPALECVGTVERPSLALDAIERLKPDVITLDIHMPEMDGVVLLKKILERHLIPTVMISALSRDDGTAVLDALEAGAVDYIQKPSMHELKILAPVICEKIRDARYAKIRRPLNVLATKNPLGLGSGADATDFSNLIAIGSSTGGTEALRTVLTALPAHIPPIVIVQHIPPVFSKAFSDRMNQLCPFEVKEAEDGDVVREDRVLVAPGGKQMRVRKVGNDLRVIIDDSEPVNRHKPSVDVLFDSIVSLQRKKVVAAVLTGMGSDGAAGLLRLRQSGARTVAQDEATSVVYGMPKEALKNGGAEEAVALEKVAAWLWKACSSIKRSQVA